jgi:hypothetical protein
VDASRRRWGIWIVTTLATLPASALLWFVGAMAAGGGEIYDPPPPVFVDPGVPGGWELIAASPTLIALVGGFIGLHRRRPGLFAFAMAAPFMLVVLGVLAILAID